MSTRTKSFFAAVSPIAALCLLVLAVAAPAMAQPADKTLTININPPGAGTATGAGTFPHNSTVPVQAFPGVGYIFLNWTGNVANTTANPTTVQLPQNRTITANFVLIDTTPPEIEECAGDQTVSADALCEAEVPDFTGGVVATDNQTPAGLLVITQDPVAGTVLGLGEHTVTITVTDEQDNSDTCTATLTVADTTPPEITQCAAAQVEVADENCEALVPDFTWDVTAADNCDPNPVITQDPAAGTVVGRGVTPVTITVTDADGNFDTCVVNFTVTEDVPPTGTIFINNNLSVTNSPDVTLNLTWDDGECASGVVRMRFSNDGRTWSAWEPLLASKPWTLPGPDGFNTVRVQYRDRANNVSDRFSDFIRLDTIAPTGTIWINNNAWRTFNRNVNLNLTWDDAGGSGVVRMRFSQDGRTWTAWEPLKATKPITLTGPIGYNTVRVQYRDAGGNVSVAYNDYILLAE